MVSRVTSRAANFLGLFRGNRLQVLAQLVENDGRVVRLQLAVSLVHVRTRKHVVALNRQEALSNRKERPAQVERWLVEEHCFRSVTQRGIDVSESEVERHNSRCVFKSGVEEFQRVFRITGAVQDVSKIQQRHVFRFVRCELVRHSRTRDRLDSVATHSPKQCRHVVEHPRTRKLKTTASNVWDCNITTVAIINCSILLSEARERFVCQDLPHSPQTCRSNSETGQWDQSRMMTKNAMKCTSLTKQTCAPLVCN